MKKIVFLLGFLFCIYLIRAQKIMLLSDSILLTNNQGEKIYDILYTIIDTTSAAAKYNITIEDNLDGSAIPNKHYIQNTEFNNQGWTFNNRGDSYKIKLLKRDKCDITNKTIILHVKAIPPSKDTTYRATFTFIIHRTDISLTFKEKKERRECRKDAKQKGTNWFNNNQIERNIDNTNTPKTEFITYTDLKGFDPDAPNGLAQNQFLFKWPIEKHWLINHENFKLQYLRSFLFPNFLLNRIDKTNDVVLYKPYYDSIDTNNNGTVDSFPLTNRNINSFDVIKYSNIVLNGKLTLLNIQFPKSRIMLEYDVSVYRMKMDSAKISQTFDPIYAISKGPHIFFETGNADLSDAFQLRVIMGYEVLRIRSNNFSQIDGISSSVQNDTLNSKTPSFPNVNKSSKIWALSTRLSRNISKDNKTSIFFRINLSWQKIKNNPLSITKSYNQYAQFQLGLNADINAFGGSK